MGALFASQRHDTSPTTELFRIYVQYKKDTRAIVSWLLSHQPADGPATSPGKLSVRDLIAIAERTCAMAVAMPEVIAFQFRQAITARTHLSKAFRQVGKGSGESASTEDHEFFTARSATHLLTLYPSAPVVHADGLDSLTKIYTDLCKHCAKPKDTCNHPCWQEDHPSQDRICTNRFDSLRTECNENGLSTFSNTPPARTGSTEEAGRSSVAVAAEAPSGIYDDRLSSTFEVYQHVHEVHRILNGVKAVWREAAQGSSQLVTATIITNAAYSQLEDVEHRLTTSCNIVNSADLLESYKRMREHFDSVGSTEVAVESSAVDAINDLNECWHAMKTLRSRAAKDGFTEKVLKAQLPLQVSLRQGPDTSTSDAQCRSILLYNVVQCIKSSRLQNNFTRLGSPVVAEVGFFMSREQTPSNCMHCASGLSLLMSSYKAYSFALPAGQHTSDCRIHALRYAQGAVAQISAVLENPTMPCRCHGTLAFHLDKLKLDFEDYLRTKMFDLFFQSPWVCGGQILEMMHALHYYGLRLAAYKSYMGSVVHMYNVLREIHGFPCIPVLEAICEHLGDLFFPGGRPKNRTFKSCYVRYLGGRLRFHGQARHRNGCHELAIPAHTAKATAGFSSGGVAERDPRFDCGRLSLLYRIKERNYRVDDATWDAIVCQTHRNGGVGLCDTQDSHKNWPRRRRGASGHAVNTGSYKSGAVLDHAGNVSATEVFPSSQALQQALDAELASSFPIASLDFFPLYLNCAKIVDKISNAYHGPDSKQGQYCLCYAEILVAAADGCREGKGLRVRREIRELVEICGRAIKDELGEKEVAQYGSGRS